jgi:hypothetical protein
MWHTWRATHDTLHAYTWSSYYIWSTFLEGALVEHILGRRTCRAHSWRAHYLWSYIFYYSMEFWHGQNPNLALSPWICLVGDGPLAIFGFDYFISCGALHLLGTLHIHPWSCLPWDSHMWIGYMHLVDHLLFYEISYGAFS